MQQYPPLGTALAHRVHRLQRLLRRHFLAKAAEHGFALTPEQYFLLDKLLRKDGQSQGSLADDALQDNPNLTRMLKDLEGRGLLARRRDPADGRVRRVHLTRAGAALHEDFTQRVVLPSRSELFDDLDPAQIAAAHAVFDALEAKLS